MEESRGAIVAGACFCLKSYSLSEPADQFRPMQMPDALNIELRLFPLDDARVDALTAWEQWGRCKILQQALIATRYLVGTNHLELGDSILHHTRGMHKAEPVGVDPRLHGGLMHEEPDGIMGDQ